MIHFFCLNPWYGLNKRKGVKYVLFLCDIICCFGNYFYCLFFSCFPSYLVPSSIFPSCFFFYFKQQKLIFIVGFASLCDFSPFVFFCCFKKSPCQSCRKHRKMSMNLGAGIIAYREQCLQLVYTLVLGTAIVLAFNMNPSHQDRP